MKTAALLAASFLAFGAAPATADAPTLDARVAFLEQYVDELYQQVEYIDNTSRFAEMLAECLAKPRAYRMVDGGLRPTSARKATVFLATWDQKCVAKPAPPAPDPSWDPFTGPVQ